MPGVSNVYEKVSPGKRSPESNRPSRVTVCTLFPMFVQQTVVP